MVQRLITATYNSQALAELIDKFSLVETYDKITFSCDFIVTSDTPDNLVSACTTLEAALREPNKDLVITLGSGTEYNFSHSSNTGMLGEPQLSVVPSQFQLAVSRHYNWSITFERPADQSGQGYRRDGKISIAKDEFDIVTVTASGTYTAGSTNSAIDNYEDGTTGGQAWASSFLSGLGSGIFELRAEETEYEKENKILTFSLVYKEREKFIGVGYDEHGRKTLTFRGTFAASGSNAISLYTSNAKTWAEAQISDWGAETYALTSENVDYEHDKQFCRFTLVYTELKKDVKISYDIFGRKEISCSGTYAAVSGGNNAKQEYDANAKTWAESILAEYGGDYDLTAESIDYEKDKQFVYFSLVYKEQTKEVNVVYDAAKRRRITFNGTYSDTDVLTALGHFESEAESWAEGILTSTWGGATEYELVNKVVNYEDGNTFMSFTLSYQERLYNDSSAGDDPAVQDAQIIYSTRKSNVGGATLDGNRVVTPEEKVGIVYNCKLDNTLLNSAGNARSIYLNNCRPWVVSHVKTVLGIKSSKLLIEEENFRWAPTSCEMSGEITFSVPGSDIVDYQESITQNWRSGLTMEKIWDGQDHTYHKWGPGARLEAMQNVSITKVGSVPAEPAFLSGGWVLIDASETNSTPQMVDNTIRYSKSYSRQYIYEQSGGQSGTTTPTAGTSATTTSGGAVGRERPSAGSAAVTSMGGASGSMI